MGKKQGRSLFLTDALSIEQITEKRNLPAHDRYF